MKAYSYLRTSGVSQKDNDGFPRQREAVARWAAANGAQVVDEFVDEAVSGAADLDCREGLMSLLAAIDKSDVRTVIVESAHRLARELTVSELLLKQFADLGVAVIDSMAGVDLTVPDSDPTKMLIRHVLAAVAQYEKSCLVLKLRVARERARRLNGRCEGAKPFGQTEDERRSLERIRQLASLPQTHIARILEAENMPTRFGGRWSQQQVSIYLRKLGLHKKSEHPF